MRLKIKLLFFILLFLFPQKANAGQSRSIYYLSPDAAGHETVMSKSFCFEGDFSEEAILYVLFSNFVNNGFNYVPPNTRLLSVSLNDGHLFLNFSKDILSYGGSAYELGMLKQILLTAFDIPGVNDVTLLIENNLVCLPEGSLVDKVTKEYIPL